jgi:predicted house-cleaning NTP pyrophosphatase (Maf/HAM1 superfamily)
MIVERIVGAFDNVMGLPVEGVLDALAEVGLGKA